MRVPILAALLAAVCPAAADFQSLYEQGRLFDLRDAVAAGGAPAFFRAVVACSFHEVSCVEQGKAILDAKPSPELAVKVYDLLENFHFAYGRWADALAATEAEVALRGESADPDNTRSLLRAFLRYGPVTVERTAHSSIWVLYKNAHVPFRVNGRSYRGYLDTGANISVLTESAARRLGLATENVQVHFGDASGKGLTVKQVAVAEHFVIGNMELRNVPFMIVSDRQQPFAGWGAGKRCILGLQVLLAARNMTWKRALVGASLELARPGAARDPGTANFCFDGTAPLTAAAYQGRRVTLFVDTGAGKSQLHAAFAAGFPEAMKGAPRRNIYFEGIGGGTQAEAAILPAIFLRIDGRDAGFRRIPVYLKGQGANRYDGMFGNDLAGKAREFSVDFQAMRLTLR